MATAYVKTLERQGEYNDIAIRNRDFAFSEGKHAYADIIAAAVLTVRGELIYNIRQGIPYFDTAFLSPIYLASWAADVQKRIKEFDFVEDIKSFEYDFDPDAGKVKYTASIQTDAGLVTVEG